MNLIVTLYLLVLGATPSSIEPAIGAAGRVGVRLESTKPFPKIVEFYVGGPAESHPDIFIGSYITSIQTPTGYVSTVQMSAQKATTLLSGDPGTTAIFTIANSTNFSNAKEVRLVRKSRRIWFKITTP